MYTINGVYQLDADTFQVLETSAHVNGNVEIVLRVDEQLLSGKNLIFAQKIQGEQPKITIYLDSAHDGVVLLASPEENSVAMSLEPLDYSKF